MRIITIEKDCLLERGRVFHFLILGFVLLLMMGCASFPENRLAKINGIESQARFANKPTIYVALRYMFDISGDNSNPVEITGPLPMFRQITEKVITEASLFQSHTFDSFQAKNVDYTLQMELTNYGSGGKAAAAGLITGLTLFIIPTAATDNYKLTARLFDRDGKLLKSYSYEDGITTWLGIWLIPMAGNTPKSACEDVLENMIQTLFSDILKDGILKYSSLQPPIFAKLILPY